jgi:hypothetical protein
MISGEVLGIRCTTLYYCPGQKRYDMNIRFQMQREVKTGFAERVQCKLVLLRLSLAGNLEKPLCPSMGPNGGSVAFSGEVLEDKVYYIDLE